MSRRFVQEAGGQALRELVRLLNNGFNEEHHLASKAHTMLIQIVQAWQHAQTAPITPFERVLASDLSEPGKPPVQPRVPLLLRMQFPVGCPDWNEIQSRMRTILAPRGTGADLEAEYGGPGPGKSWSACDVALLFFVRFIRDSQRDTLRGPCPQCGEYFIKGTAKEKKYCSRNCASRGSALSSTKRIRQGEHEEKIDRARKAIKQWNPVRYKTWQEWVTNSNPDITKKFLTRAVNNKEIQPPQERNVRRGKTMMATIR